MRLLILISLVLSCMYSYAQTGINTVQFKDLDSLMKVEHKPVYIFIKADWCKYCKLMEKTVFNDDEIINQLNNSYYFVELNAESKDSIHFLNRDYIPNYKGSNKHELAEKLLNLNKNTSLPTSVVFSKELSPTLIFSGFKNRLEIKAYLSKLNN